MGIHLRPAQVAGVALLACTLQSFAQKDSRVKADPWVFMSHVATKEAVLANPYSAEGVSEVTQTLSDGSTRTRKITSHLYRASDGRIRLEESIITGHRLWEDAGGESRRISVFDPTSRDGFVLDPQTMLFERYSESGSAEMPAHIAGIKEEPLGTQVLEGLTIEGTRRTKVIRGGQKENAEPAAIVDESWYSRDLHVVVMTRHSDPQLGNVVYKLTHIDRTEPAASLFEVPAGYREAGKKIKAQR